MNDAIEKDVPAILLEVTSVDKDNLMTTVIKDGYAKYEDVYKNVPERAEIAVRYRPYVVIADGPLAPNRTDLNPPYLRYASLVYAADLGGTNIRMAAVDGEGSILHHTKKPVPGGQARAV